MYCQYGTCLHLQVEIAFSTSSPSGFPTNYYLKCIFPHPVTTVSKDLGDTNMVLTINKTTGAFWDSFLFGGSDDGADMQVRAADSSFSVET